MAHPNDGIAEERNLLEVVDEEDEELLEIDKQGNVTATDLEEPVLENTTPKKRVCARFGRKHTLNEQILVVPCGMILAHETFYGAEAIGTCAVRMIPLSINNHLLSHCNIRNSSSELFESIDRCQITFFSIIIAVLQNM